MAAKWWQAKIAEPQTPKKSKKQKSVQPKQKYLLLYNIFNITKR
jgi:hypothetical protein